jgi:hypothetical protein
MLLINYAVVVVTEASLVIEELGNSRWLAVGTRRGFIFGHCRKISTDTAADALK